MTAATLRFVRLTGATGSGKTALLRRLVILGAQALDLEALAGHRGSIFGAMAGINQPTPAQWLERISRYLDACDSARPIWVEDKGSFLGRLTIPEPLQQQLQSADVVEVRSSMDLRIAHLASEYVSGSTNELLKALKKLRSRLPPGDGERAVALLARGQVDEAIRLVLPYYDAAYAVRGKERVLGTVDFSPVTLGACAQHLVGIP